MPETPELDAWKSGFGREYTDRNALTLDGMEELWRKNYGRSRTDLNRVFLNDMDRSIRILEVGSNVGNQLLCLQKMGFKNLYGIDPQSYAVELSKSRTNGINIIEADAFDIPFKEGYFDLVFTSGVLIHIAPKDVRRAMVEIHRCSKRYVFGFEYYSQGHEAVEYRGKKDLLWKADFPMVYMQTCPDLKLVRSEPIKYLSNDNVDVMFLLEKQQ